MASTPMSSQASSPEISPPSGFHTLHQIRSMESAKLKAKVAVNVIAFVKDYQPPYQTRGTDFKCTVALMDLSIRDDPHGHGVKLTMFWELQRMPRIHGSGDVLLIRNAKSQMFEATPGLLASWGTSIHVLAKDRIPKTLPKSGAPWVSTPPDARKPNPAETNYVIAVNKQSDELLLPTTQEFQDRSMQAMNVKNKFSILKDVKPDTFHDIMGEVRRTYDSGGDRLQLYISDYSPNSMFYKYAWGGAREDSTSNGRDGDEYGYIKSKLKPQKDWPGPFGKLTIQLSVYDAHAEFVREHVKEGDWVLLKNVQFKIGNQGGILEGYLRGDQGAFGGKVQVHIMRKDDEAEDIDVRWKEALKRKLDWKQKFKAQTQAIVADQEQTGDKRKRSSDGSAIKNGKQRRKERRAAAAAKEAVAAAHPSGKALGLNENVRCSHHDVPTTTLSDILKPLPLPLKESQNGITISPFTVAKYRANVRIVDYFPHRIEDFAVGRRVTEFDVLSDYSGGEESDPEEDMRHFRSGKGFPPRKWEWRFALNIEDAEAAESAKKEQIWLIVDNEAAQGLLSLEQDATNLRTDPNTLRDLKEQLFKLWGELEERKSALLPPLGVKATPKVSRVPQSSDMSAIAASSPPEVIGMPDPDSENETEHSENRHERSVLKEKDTNASTGKAVPETPKADKKSEEVCTEVSIRNKPFTCCIKQYGVKVKEDDPTTASAGEGMRWDRRFGIFGTTIH